MFLSESTAPHISAGTHNSSFSEHSVRPFLPLLVLVLSCIWPLHLLCVTGSPCEATRLLELCSALVHSPWFITRTVWSLTPFSVSQAGVICPHFSFILSYKGCLCLSSLAQRKLLKSSPCPSCLCISTVFRTAFCSYKLVDKCFPNYSSAQCFFPLKHIIKSVPITSTNECF